MIIDLNELNNKDVIEFNYEVNKDNELDKRIINLEKTFVKGTCSLDYDSNVVLKYDLKGIMIINDSISLEEIPYKFNISYEEKLDDIIKNNNDCYDNIKNTLDLKMILWQNIVLEVPISYTKVIDANLKGNGWELVNEKDKVNEIDPRLKKLEELLERRD